MSVIIGCSGWSYSDSFERRLHHQTIKLKKLQYYSQFFDTAEMDATFYEKFYIIIRINEFHYDNHIY